jgi:tRNA dimethylallyltransferase
MVQENCINKKILIICGPTASGKTALAVECAKLLNSEVVSADSLYIYKGLNVGTAKPDESEMQGVKHYLIDVCEPNQEFSVSDYKNLALPIIEDLLSKGKIPVICGGTGFYINSILFDLSYGNSQANLEAREKYKKLAEDFGNEYVYNILMELDPKTAEKLHFNDVKRVIRALEIYESGTKKSDIVDDLTPKYDYKAYSINFDREILYDRINLRVDKMLENWLVEEIKSLLALGINESNQCMQGIGYKEILGYLKGNISLEEALNLIKLNTRHYAKRQITFFKRLNGLIYLTPDNTKDLAKRIVAEL